MSLLASVSNLPVDLLRDVITKLDYITTLNLKSAAASALGNTDVVLECKRRVNPNIYINNNLCDAALMQTILQKHDCLFYGSGASNFYGHDSYTAEGEWGLAVRRSTSGPTTIISDMEKIGFELELVERSISMEPGYVVNCRTHYVRKGRPSFILDGPTVRSNVDVYNNMLTEQGQEMLKEICSGNHECYMFWWDLYMLTPNEYVWPVVNSDYSSLPMNEGITMTKDHNGTKVRINIIFITNRAIDFIRQPENFSLGSMMSHHCRNHSIV